MDLSNDKHAGMFHQLCTRCTTYIIRFCHVALQTFQTTLTTSIHSLSRRVSQRAFAFRAFCARQTRFVHQIFISLKDVYSTKPVGPTDWHIYPHIMARVQNARCNTVPRTEPPPAARLSSQTRTRACTGFRFSFRSDPQPYCYTYHLDGLWHTCQRERARAYAHKYNERYT